MLLPVIVVIWPSEASNHSTPHASVPAPHPQTPESTTTSSHEQAKVHSRSGVAVLLQVLVEFEPAEAANQHLPQQHTHSTTNQQQHHPMNQLESTADRVLPCCCRGATNLSPPKHRTTQNHSHLSQRHTLSPANQQQHYLMTQQQFTADRVSPCCLR